MTTLLFYRLITLLRHKAFFNHWLDSNETSKNLFFKKQMKKEPRNDKFSFAHSPLSLETFPLLYSSDVSIHNFKWCWLYTSTSNVKFWITLIISLFLKELVGLLIYYYIFLLCTIVEIICFSTIIMCSIYYYYVYLLFIW